VSNPLIITILWVLTGCIADVRITYKNGYQLTLTGWPTGVYRWWKGKP
jgi:hypothetical protein